MALLLQRPKRMEVTLQLEEERSWFAVDWAAAGAVGVPVRRLRLGLRRRVVEDQNSEFIHFPLPVGVLLSFHDVMDGVEAGDGGGV